MYLHTRVYKTDLALSTNVSKKLCCLFTDFSSPVLPIKVLVFLITWLPCNEKSSKSNTNGQKYRSNEEQAGILIKNFSNPIYSLKVHIL